MVKKVTHLFGKCVILCFYFIFRGLELSSLWNHKLYKPLPTELFKDFELGSTCEFITQTVDVQGILLSKMQDAEVSYISISS